MLKCKRCRRNYELNGRAFNQTYCSFECMKAATAPLPTPEVERLTAECPRHGVVRPVCPKCAGETGGKANRGSHWGAKWMRRATGQPLRNRGPR
jgi:hypothetical protein